MSEVKILSRLVSEYSANLNSGLQNSASFQPIFTNELSKSKLRFSLSNKVYFVDSSDFKAELFFSKLV